ncbi:hypothetical protein [Endozoicomonas euniceicola]|uniref:Uncharacterized protein n=1 Tax=Endozoicomonas euniceicola TaxID=1234143 RepID=A0ABY6GQX6_9GAMM|nr:hypothetical protein [Endozoicomonas euniceicola]UYM14799.1 hypothetical protein NX720_18150 [Endozoicomonas euniceicola]
MERVMERVQINRQIGWLTIPVLAELVEFILLIRVVGIFTSPFAIYIHLLDLPSGCEQWRLQQQIKSR